MEHTLAPYECQFSVEERKRMVAQTMAELRKGKGISQKEAAALIGVSQATYSAYERGRNEPPLEMIVRLSYLFGCPVDWLIQRDRLFRTQRDAAKDIKELRRQMQEFEEHMEENGGDNPTARAFFDTLSHLAEQLEKVNSAAAVAQSYDEALTKK